MKVSDYFAELYVAGRFADEDWNVYFPHRDQGFDFVVAKTLADGTELIRPVQVKGKYPSRSKTDKAVYGYVGKLTQLHPEMVLAIPFFSSQSPGTPIFVAYMPYSQVRTHSRGFRCQPAMFKEGSPVPRPAFLKFVNSDGLRLLEKNDWKDSKPNDA